MVFIPMEIPYLAVRNWCFTMETSLFSLAELKLLSRAELQLIEIPIQPGLIQFPIENMIQRGWIATFYGRIELLGFSVNTFSPLPQFSLA